MLYQTGYLTIDYRDEYGLYHLKYPNHEVENSMAYLLENYGSISKDNSLSMDAYTVGISFSDA